MIYCLFLIQRGQGMSLIQGGSDIKTKHLLKRNSDLRGHQQSLFVRFETKQNQAKRKSQR